MKVVLFGATGMLGQGALRECLLATDVELVLAVVRNPTGRKHDKLRELVHADMLDVGALEPELRGYDACLFCLGVSSAGMSETEYTRLTYDLTIGVARVVARASPNAAFVYVSGAGTDSTERGRSMWARVKGRTENELLRLPFKAAYNFRPGVILALHGIKPRTKVYRVAYAALGPFLPLVRAVFPNAVLTTEIVGRAMLEAVRRGGPSRTIEAAEITELGKVEQIPSRPPAEP
jgi:uncharacterized protein YbjT (DUF2867 family)